MHICIDQQFMQVLSIVFLFKAVNHRPRIIAALPISSRTRSDAANICTSIGKSIQKVSSLSNIKFDATYSYVATSNSHISMIRIYSINAITTQDDGMFRSLKEWVQSLKKFSTQISESGEMQRIRFFNEQREIINTL